MGIYSMLTQLGPVAGPFLGELNYLRFVTLLISFIGGLISQTLGWRYFFFWYLFSLLRYSLGGFFGYWQSCPLYYGLL